MKLGSMHTTHNVYVIRTLLIRELIGFTKSNIFFVLNSTKPLSYVNLPDVWHRIKQ